VRRKLETSRARRIKPLMTPQELRKFQDIKRNAEYEQHYSQWNHKNPS
jgi:hypothetical protein